MKRLFCLRSPVVLCLFALIHSGVCVFAQQSPTTIKGLTYDTEIESATGPYATAGSYRWIMSENGTYQAFRIAGNIGDETGSFVYQRTTAESGRMSFNDHVRTGFSQLFTYKTINRGEFFLGNVGFPGLQTGTFKVYSGTGPANFVRKVFVVSNPTGTLGFGGGGNYRIVTLSNNDYVVQNVAGTVIRHSGTYTYTRPARSSGIIRFQDTSHSVGLAIMTFENAAGTVGSSFIRSTNGNVQLGTFTVSDLRTPSFLAHPSSRTVTVGQSTTFSTTVTGTGPFTYQWFKNTNSISEATSQPTYTIPIVQTSDSGTYKVLVRNLAGEAVSSGAVLTAVCGYSVSPAKIVINYRGGARETTVNATGNCTWSAATTNSWITITSPASNVQGTAVLSFTIAENLTAKARSGNIRVAGKTIAIFQGATFAPEDLAGKTFALRMTDGVGLVAQTGTNLVIFSPGTNRTATVVAPNGDHAPSTIEYNFTRISNDSVVLTWGEAQVQFLYETARAGSFFGTNIFGNYTAGTFRWAPSTPDFDKDTRGDLAWQAGTRALAGWFLRGKTFVSLSALANATPAPDGWRAVGSADFNRDGQTDVVFQDSAGRLNVWLMNGKLRIGTVSLRNGIAATGWRAVAVAHLNNDGRADVLFQAADGRLMGWLFNGTSFAGGFQIRGGLSGGAAWKAVAAADFNQDGQTDIAVQNTNGQVALWYLNNGALISIETVRGGITPTGWKLIGAGDVDEDGDADLLMLTSNREVALWVMEGKTFSANVYLRDRTPVTTGWVFVAPN